MNLTRQEWIQKLEADLGIDEEDIIEVCEIFFDELPTELSNMRNVYANNDIKILSRLAHGLKGSAANIGFLTVSELAKQIEIMAKQNKVADLDKYLKDIEEATEELKIFVGI